MLRRSCAWLARALLIALALSLSLPVFLYVGLGLDFAHAVPKAPLVAQANGFSATATEPPKPEEEVARDSPRASMADFLALARANQYEQAARYLELPHDQAARGAVLARRIKAVLDRKAWVDVEKLSPLSTGDLEDDLPRYTEEIARFAGPDGVPEPVRLVRRNLDGGRWLFSESTVRHIDGWYARLTDVWFLENLPPWLLRSGPKET
jgi:hypothetical protein